MPLPDYKEISHILWRHDPMQTGCQLSTSMYDAYHAPARIMCDKLGQHTAPVRFKALRLALFDSFESAFGQACQQNQALQDALQRIWLDFFKPAKKQRPELIAYEKRMQTQHNQDPVYTYPCQRTNPFQWTPPHLCADGITPAFPPHPPELRKPLLWLVSSLNQAWLVNLCDQSLPFVSAGRTGFGSYDDGSFGYNAEKDWVYHNLPANHCALVDEWDDYYDLDYCLFCHLKIEVPGFGTMSFSLGGGWQKGCIATQVLLWNTGERGKLK